MPQPIVTTQADYDVFKAQRDADKKFLFTQPQQTAPQDQQDDENAPSFFEMPPMVQNTPELDRMYDGDRKQFYEAFARGFNSRRFTGLKDYENWLRSLPGVIQEIRPYVQEIGEKYMPTSARQEYELKQQDKEARQKIRMQVSQMRAMQDEMKRQGLPFDLSTDSKGNIVPKARNDQTEIKAHEARLKNLIGMKEKAADPKLRDYLQEQIDTLMQGQESATGAGSPVSGASGGMTREAFIQGFTAKKGYPPTEAMIQKVIARGLVR